MNRSASWATPGNLLGVVLAGLLASSACALAQSTEAEPRVLADNQSKLRRTLGSESGSVGCELQDRDGNLWFSTPGNGVFRFDGRSFTNFTTKDGLSDNSVGEILQDRAGNIVFATSRGLCMYDGKAFTRRAELSEEPILSLLEDREGKLWVATFNKGVFCLDGASMTNVLNGGTFNLGTPNQFVLDMLQDSKGNLWFSSWNGGGVWRYDGKDFKNYLPSADYYEVKDGYSDDGRAGLPTPPDAPYVSKTAAISDDMIFCIAEDSSGALWFGTRRHGACRYDPVKDEFTTFREHEGFVSAAVYCIAEDRERNLWLATEGSGVWRYDGKQFKRFSKQDGLVNDSVFSILEDKAGHLWFGTREVGLSRYDGSTFTTYSD
jgi:ligand-binding sensor domain-containing protein